LNQFDYIEVFKGNKKTTSPIYHFHSIQSHIVNPQVSLQIRIFKEQIIDHENGTLNKRNTKTSRKNPNVCD
jgi:hypothetical protein